MEDVSLAEIDYDDEIVTLKLNIRKAGQFHEKLKVIGTMTLDELH